MITVTDATDPHAWDAFLAARRYRPFLQSWTMGEVYRAIGQEPVRLEMRDADAIVGICQAILVPARRGRHLAVPYGPVLADGQEAAPLLDALRIKAKESRCTFLRLSPFWPRSSAQAIPGALPSPLHLLSEHTWYLPMQTPDPWTQDGGTSVKEEDLLMGMRKTTRNLVRRAEKDGVTVEASRDPVADLARFIALHDETRKRHKFTPYTNAFFRAQVAAFAPRNEVTVYLARYQDQVIAASIHMHAFGETSYHHGASSSAFPKVPASYLLQWTAIKDALKRGDRIYSFWGIAPIEVDSGQWTHSTGSGQAVDSEEKKGSSVKVKDPKHPFAGVTLFKTGFGGSLLDLTHCLDVPLSPSYRLTRAFEFARKWKRGF